MSSLRLFIVSQHRALSGVLERSVFAGFLSKFDPPQISSLILSRRVRKACGWPLRVLSAFSSSLPANTGDVRSISAERNSWYRAARAAEERWLTPIALNMAMIYQESSFRAPQKRAFPVGILRSSAVKCFWLRSGAGVNMAGISAAVRKRFCLAV